MNKSESWTWEGPPDNIHVVEADRPHMRICFLTSNGPTVKRANLIAAAPELLESLKVTVRMLEAAHRELGMYTAHDKRITAAQAAIAKSEGREAQ